MASSARATWTWRRPATLVAAFYGAVVIALLATHAWDPRFFATVGPQWQRHDPSLSKQADGRIFFDFATDPVAAAHRYERRRTVRILYPFAAHVLAFGRADLVGWPLLLVNLAAIALGTEILHRLLERQGRSPWPALAYGAWYGLGLALLHDTSEPLAYLCALAGIYAQERGRAVVAGIAFLGALLTRETTALLVVPFLLFPRDRRDRSHWVIGFGVLGTWGLWYGVVALVGRGAITPAPWAPALPLIGYLATRASDLPITIVCLVVPALVVLGWAARELRHGPADLALWAVALNALFVLWFPPKTTELLWHSGRLATGLVAATLLASRLAASGPRLWRALTIVFASSACWTIAVALRFLLWNIAPW